MSTQADKIRGALNHMAEVAKVNDWPMIHSQATVALAALSKLEAQTAQAHSPSVEQRVEAAAPRGAKSSKRPRKKLCKQWPNCTCIIRGEIVNGMCGGLPT